MSETFVSLPTVTTTYNKLEFARIVDLRMPAWGAVLLCCYQEGVYAETLLSKYSSTEKIDLSRRVDYKYMEMVQATDIDPVSAASRRGAALTDVSSQGIAAAVLEQKTPEAAPPPIDTASIINSMSKFSDLSSLTKSIEAANQGLEQIVGANVAHAKEVSAAQQENIKSITSMQAKGMEFSKEVAMEAMRQQSARDANTPKVSPSDLAAMMSVVEGSDLPKEDKEQIMKDKLGVQQKPASEKSGCCSGSCNSGTGTSSGMPASKK
jgi:hypothetical protein